MALRQYRQTWVKGMIGRGSVLETKVAYNEITSGGRRFAGRREFLKVFTSRRTSLARFSRASTCETPRQHSRMRLRILRRRTSDVNLVAKARETGGSDCTLLHSINSFLFNALMSCSTESSRTESRDMVAATNRVTPRHNFGQLIAGRSSISTWVDIQCARLQLVSHLCMLVAIA